MGMEVYLVVGDEYCEFAKHSGVLTVSDALRELRTPGSELRGAAFHVGQGIDRALRLELEHAADAVKASVHPVLGGAPLALTHKSNEESVLITAPLKAAPGNYLAELTIGNQVDRLSDHVTGQHVAGMVLVESARQLGIAALELEYGVDGAMPYGLVWRGLSSKFMAYAFPIPTGISLQIVEDTAKTRRGQIQVTLTFQLSQCSQTIAVVVMDTALIEKTSLRKIEMRQAAQVVEKLRAKPSVAIDDGAPREYFVPPIPLACLAAR